MAAKGAILDGVVRTTPQADGLADTLATLGRQLTAVLLFEVDEDELVRRLSGRTTCDMCQRPFFGREPGETCTEGGQSGTLVRRKDDEPEAIRKRMQVYRDQTAPVIDWYASNGANMVRVNAIGTLADVEARVHAALGIS
jgi:adenylate kinase